MWIVKSSLLLCLAAIFFFDIKYRAVFWWLYVLVFASSVYIALQQNTIVDWAIQSALNLGILAIQFFVVQTWYILRVKRFEFMFHKALGIGDVLFLLCPAVLFPVQFFMLFLVIGFSVSLLFHFIALKIFANYKKTVPLAGYLSIVLLAAIVGIDTHVIHIM